MNKEKIRFCKYCGSEINMEEKICTGCGKQFFSAKKSIIPAFKFCFVLMFIASIIVNIWFFFNYKEVESLKSELFQLEAERDAARTSLDNMKKLYDKLEKDYKASEDKRIKYTNLYMQYKIDCAYITATGEKYHTYDCAYIQNCNTKIYVDTIYDLKKQGYYQCSECY